MKKILTVIFLFIAMHDVSNAQADSGYEHLRHSLDTARQDTTRVLLMAYLANYYQTNLPDSALFYGYKALALARQIKFPEGEVEALGFMAAALVTLGNDSKALQMSLQDLKIAEQNNLIEGKAGGLEAVGYMYNKVENHRKALDLLKQAKTLNDSLHNFAQSAFVQNSIGETYFIMNELDSALYYCQSAYENSRKLKEDWPLSYILYNLGRIENKKDNRDVALAYFRQSLSLGWNTDIIFKSYFSIAQLYQQINKQDSSIHYANKSLEVVKGRGLYSDMIEANILLSGIYEKSDPRKALQHSKMAIAYKDSLDNLGKTTSFENLIAFDEQERQYEIDTATATYRSQIKQYVLIAALMVFLLIVFILYRNNRQKQKAKVKIEKAYEELKSAQSQLIQQEKMASLGELTAGIAHEIQNPLNFVNNFSEVNKEMIVELKEEIDKGNYEEVKLIANDIEENEEKINHHGKRADAIVKGMLQHSKASTGKKEPTDINASCDEYLRLAYHGMRAKDKNFNAELKTDFDESITKMNVVPQDIGRVLLNLFNNAFYAVNERQKADPHPLKGGKEYVPEVTVVTKNAGDKVEIRVADNGNGIPQNIVDKIFQPFFTTKPTGQGTGLGLSLAYDIIKAHGGKIGVDTKDGEGLPGEQMGSEFVIQLPV